MASLPRRLLLPELLTVQDALARHRDLVVDARLNPRLEGLIWEATLACNLACGHCGNPVEGKEGDGPWKHGDELSTDEVKRIFREVAEDFPPGTISIGITGGEATLRKDLCEIVAYMRELGFRVSLTTNGYLTGKDPALLDRLVESGVSLFTISVDGLRESHDRQRGVPGSFDLVKATLERLRDVHPKVEVVVNTCATPYNWSDIPGVYALMQELEVKRWHLGPVSPVGRAVDPLTHLTHEQIRDLLEWMGEKNKPANVEASGVHVSWFCDGWVGAMFEPRVREAGMFFCGAGTRIASVLYDGKAATCLEVRRSIGVQGDLREERLSQIWAREYGWFREDRAKFRQGPCATCEEWDWCQGSSLHLREENGELVECIFHRQSQAKPREDGLPAAIDTVELAPLTIVDRDGTWVVGNDDTGTFAEMPPIGVTIVRALQAEPDVEKARAKVRDESGRDVDVAAFVRSIAAGGFVAKVNGQALDAATLPRRRRKLFEGVRPERLGWLRSSAFWWACLLPFGAAIGAMIADPYYWPTWTSFLVSPIYTIVGLSMFAVMTTLVLKHELGHVLMARALGSRASLGIGTRLAYIVMETDASNLWVLSKKDRMKVYAAGMATDLFVIGVATMLLVLGREGVVPALAHPLVVAYAKLAVLASVLMVLFQFMFQVRTDIYYIVAHGLDCRNLYGDARQWLRRGFSWLVPRWRTTPKVDAAPREMRWVRAYGVLHFVGVGVFFAYFFAFIVPTLLHVYGHSISRLWSAWRDPGSQPLVAVIDATAFFFVHIAYFGTVGYISWRDRKRDATGLQISSAASTDAATRRLLSHPAPAGMLESVGGKLAQLDPERAKKRAVVLGPHLKAAALRAKREGGS